MRVHLFHQYFRYPAEGGAIRSYFLARALQEAGHEVVVFTAHNQHVGQQDIAGIPVVYLPVAYHNRFGFKKRIASYLKFVYHAIRASRKYPHPDLNYIITTPLTAGLIGLWWRRKQIPYAFEIGDLWPEVPIQMGFIRQRIVRNLLYRFERKLYLRADKLIGLSPSIKDYIEYTCDFEVSAISIPNMADVTFYELVKRKERVSAANPFQITYLGTFGVANDLSLLLSVAKLAREQKLPIQFNFMGEGAQEEMLRAAADQSGHVRLFPFGTRTEVKALMDTSDAIYVSFAEVPILGTGSPNKFFDGLAAGKLIILNFSGWIKNMVMEHECGLYHQPPYDQRLLDELIPFIESPTLLEEYQKNARRLAEEQFDTKVLLRQWMAYIEA